MSYQVLARKYRPRTFAEVIGQGGIGKTSTARILAKALNCTDGPKADFDPNDEVCLEIAEGRSMDVLEIDGASNNSVEQIRELRDNVQYAPTRGNFKIYIIDEVHMLTQAAFNALLKTLEEPPAHVKFIFATTEPHKVLPTILSRCQRFDLKRISDKDLVKQLRFIADQEKITISDSALHILARNAEGGMRDAESAFDQLISFCGTNIEEKDVLQIFGLTGPQEVWSLAEAIQAGEAEDALQQLRELIARGKDLTRLSQYLLRYFRNMLIYTISPQLANDEMEPDEAHHLSNLKPLPSRELTLAFIDELVRLEEKIRFALVKEVLFEIAIIRMTQQRQRVSLEEILSCLAKGEAPPPQAKPAPVPSLAPEPKPISAPALSPTPEPKPVAAPTLSPAPEPRPVTNATVSDKELWDRVVDPIKKKEFGMVRNALNNCEFIGANNGQIKVRLNGTVNQLDALSSSASLQAALAKAFGDGAKLQVDFIEHKEEAPAEFELTDPKPAAPSKPVSKADFENDPLIQEALKEFSARIISVKGN